MLCYDSHLYWNLVLVLETGVNLLCVPYCKHECMCLIKMLCYGLSPM